MLATSKTALFSSHNHLLITSADDPTLQLSPECQQRVIIKVEGHQHRWLAGGFFAQCNFFVVTCQKAKYSTSETICPSGDLLVK